MFATRFIALGVALLLIAEPHTTEAATVRDLLKYCRSSIDSAEYSFCLGVMDGAADLAAFATGNELIERPLSDMTLDICLAARDHAPGNLADAFVAWAAANPSAGDWDEAFGLVAAFRANWPCGSLNH